MHVSHRRFDGFGIETTVTFPLSEAHLHNALKTGAERESIPHTDVSNDTFLGIRLGQPMNDPSPFIREWYVRIGSVISAEVVDTQPL